MIGEHSQSFKVRATKYGVLNDTEDAGSIQIKRNSIRDLQDFNDFPSLLKPDPYDRHSKRISAFFE